MDASEYVEQRLDDQIEWYSKKSTANKRRYYTFRTIELAGALGVPGLAAWGAMNEGFPLELVVAITGFVIAMAAGLQSLTAAQENWLKYRTTAESLKQHKFRFLARATPYVDASLGELVSNVEALISEENTSWAQTQAESDADTADA